MSEYFYTSDNIQDCFRSVVVELGLITFSQVLQITLFFFLDFALDLTLFITGHFSLPTTQL